MWSNKAPKADTSALKVYLNNSIYRVMNCKPGGVQGNSLSFKKY